MKLVPVVIQLVFPFISNNIYNKLMKNCSEDKTQHFIPKQHWILLIQLPKHKYF